MSPQRLLALATNEYELNEVIAVGVPNEVAKRRSRPFVEVFRATGRSWPGGLGESHRL